MAYRYARSESGTMESRIKYRNLRDVAAKVARRQNPFHIIQIVQGRQIDTILDPLEHAVINERGLLLEQLPAVHDAVTDGMYSRLYS